MVRDSFATKQLCLKSDKIIIEEVSIKNQPFSSKVTCIYIVKLTAHIYVDDTAFNPLTYGLSDQQ